MTISERSVSQVIVGISDIIAEPRVVQRDGLALMNHLMAAELSILLGGSISAPLFILRFPHENKSKKGDRVITFGGQEATFSHLHILT